MDDLMVTVKGKKGTEYNFKAVPFVNGISLRCSAIYIVAKGFFRDGIFFCEQMIYIGHAQKIKQRFSNHIKTFVSNAKMRIIY